MNCQCQSFKRIVSSKSGVITGNLHVSLKVYCLTSVALDVFTMLPQNSTVTKGFGKCMPIAA